jgi:hypothetical protein
MKPKNILILLVVAILVCAWFLFKGGDEEETSNNNQQSQQQNNGSNQSQQNGGAEVEEVPNALEGELRVSTDKRRGNLMLLMNDSDRIIYLNTSRDFSALVGKQVSVSIDGSLDDFLLIDIKEKTSQ